MSYRNNSNQYKEIQRISRLITEDPDVLASPEHQALAGQAEALGGEDAASTTNIRKQLEQQRKQQRLERDKRLKKLDPYFDKLDDAEGDLQTIQALLGQQNKEHTQTIDSMGQHIPDIGRAAKGLKNNLGL